MSKDLRNYFSSTKSSTTKKPSASQPVTKTLTKRKRKSIEDKFEEPPKSKKQKVCLLDGSDDDFVATKPLPKRKTRKPNTGSILADEETPKKPRKKRSISPKNLIAEKIDKKKKKENSESEDVMDQASPSIKNNKNPPKSESKENKQPKMPVNQTKEAKFNFNPFALGGQSKENEKTKSKESSNKKTETSEEWKDDIEDFSPPVARKESPRGITKKSDGKLEKAKEESPRGKQTKGSPEKTKNSMKGETPEKKESPRSKKAEAPKADKAPRQEVKKEDKKLSSPRAKAPEKKEAASTKKQSPEKIKVPASQPEKKAKSSPRKTGKKRLAPMDIEYTSSAPQAGKKEEAEDPPAKIPAKRNWNPNYVRGTPPNKGMKPLPIGAPHCLFGKVFIITGTLDSLEREEAEALIKEYAGTTVKSASAKSLTHAVVGSEAGPKKMELIEQKKIPILDEDGLFELIRTAIPKKLSTAEKIKLEKKASPRKPKIAAVVPVIPNTKPTPMAIDTKPETKTAGSTGNNVGHVAQIKHELSNPTKGLWTTLYHPGRVVDLVGNPTNIDKLKSWLSKWTPATKEKAVLLSGPPGIGKSSSAAIVAKECGYEAIEFNASDTRSKKAIEAHVSELLGNKTISTMFSSAPKKSPNSGKTVLIMDEVDGMSGSDRGGIAKLIQLLKKTKIPIICICNDRQSSKVRSLRNYCLELQFRKPTPQQVTPRLLGIAKSEKLMVDAETIFKIATVANGDIRQMLNMMQMWHITNKNLRSNNVSDMSTKETAIGLFEVLPQLFSKTTYSQLSFNDKLNLYFSDASLVPLFVQENYTTVQPYNVDSQAQKLKKSVHLNLLSCAADSISDADLVDTAVRTSQQWSLLPLHGALSSVRPAFFMQGQMRAQQNFPNWLGKYQTTKKNHRLLREIRDHTVEKISGTSTEVATNYLPAFRKPLSTPLIQYNQDGIEDVIKVMDEYNLSREDWDSVFELTTFSITKVNPIEQINTQTKSAFTRLYNKSHTPVLSTAKAKSKSDVPSLNIEDDEEISAPAGSDQNLDDDEEEEVDEADKQLDKLIKQKKVREKKPPPAPKTTKANAKKPTPKPKGKAEEKPKEKPKFKFFGSND